MQSAVYLTILNRVPHNIEPRKTRNLFADHQLKGSNVQIEKLLIQIRRIVEYDAHTLFFDDPKQSSTLSSEPVKTALIKFNGLCQTKLDLLHHFDAHDYLLKAIRHPSDKKNKQLLKHAVYQRRDIANLLAVTSNHHRLV
jgi:hypothetical protein